MKDKIKQFTGKAKTFFTSMNAKVRKALIAVLVIAAVVIAGLLIFNAARPYTVLFTGLSQEDMSSVLTYLSNNNITNYRIENNDTILVPESQEASLKAGIMMENYPSSGFGYKTFLDNSSFINSESAQQQLQLYDLQDRLGAVIRNLNGVEEATVNLTPGSNYRYILNEDNLVEATANVTVTMEPGQTLSSKMAASIQALIASSMQGLKIDNVVILDQDGNSYSGGATANASDLSDLKMSLEARVSNLVRSRVLQAIEPYTGPDNLQVSVYCNVDVSRTFVESVEYESPEEGTNWDSLGGHGLIGEIVWDNGIIRGENGNVGGPVGTTTNSDFYEYVINETEPNGNEAQIGTSGTVRHENDKTTTQKDNAGGVITDVMVSVSINSTKVGGLDIESLYPQVATAAGISMEMMNEKIHILSMPFYVEPVIPVPGVPDGLLVQNWMIYALIAGLALFLFLLIVILLLRRKSKKKKARRAAAAAAAMAAENAAVLAAAEAAQQGAQIMDIHSERSMELRKDVRRFAEENPQIAAQMIKTWLRGGDEHG